MVTLSILNTMMVMMHAVMFHFLFIIYDFTLYNYVNWFISTAMYNIVTCQSVGDTKLEILVLFSILYNFYKDMCSAHTRLYTCFAMSYFLNFTSMIKMMVRICYVYKFYKKYSSRFCNSRVDLTSNGVRIKILNTLYLSWTSAVHTHCIMPLCRLTSSPLLSLFVPPSFSFIPVACFLCFCWMQFPNFKPQWEENFKRENYDYAAREKISK
jgi:hypothetical protein